ncbi:MAG TPA: hypothetical protein DDW65_16020 [Firmicutes bacterium]|nr:hypothetical protein [Bacillota bacterium]
MRILIIGTGVIGSTYAWQLSNAGYDVTVLVKEEAVDFFRKDGIQIEFVDKRYKKRITGKLIFRPALITIKEMTGEFDFILIPVQRQQIGKILVDIGDKVSKSTIVIFQNNWKCSEEIDELLSNKQYVYAFPHMVGGSRDGKTVKTIIFNEGNTRIGEKNNACIYSERINKLFEILERSGMRPKITENIEHWLITHYIQQSSGIGIFLKYGSPLNVVKSYKRLGELIEVGREGLQVCEKRGINARKISPIKFLYYPKWLIVLVLKMMFKDEDEKSMLGGHMKNGLEEMIVGYEEVLSEGKQRGLAMKKWESYHEFVKEAKKHIGYQQ